MTFFQVIRMFGTTNVLISCLLVLELQSTRSKWQASTESLFVINGLLNVARKSVGWTRMTFLLIKRFAFIRVDGIY